MSITQENLQELKEIYENQETITETAKIFCERHNIEYSDPLRRRVSRILNNDTTVSNKNESISITQNYEPKTVFSAVKDGKMMSIKEYCKEYGLDYDNVKSFKSITHTGTPYYNIVFYEQSLESDVSLEEFKALIEEDLRNIKYSPSKVIGSKVGVVKVADFHFGAYVNNLIRTKEFSIGIFVEMLKQAAEEINSKGYKEVHLHLLGDIIESFTGLNHRNSWKGLDKAMVGAEAVKLVTKILHEHFLSKINNLVSIKVVGGNHDRVTSDNKEDMAAEAANIVCWGLSLLGYNVEFNSLVLTHIVDGICHILTHGHHMLSKKPTKNIVWDYGKQGMFNLLVEGHLHGFAIKDDSVDSMKVVCPPFFRGNFFSEALGYTSNSGFLIIENNGKGLPNIFHHSLGSM